VGKFEMTIQSSFSVENTDKSVKLKMWSYACKLWREQDSSNRYGSSHKYWGETK